MSFQINKDKFEQKYPEKVPGHLKYILQNQKFIDLTSV